MIFNKRARLLEGILIPIALSDVHERGHDQDNLERLHHYLEEYRKLSGCDYPNSHLLPPAYLTYEEVRRNRK